MADFYATSGRWKDAHRIEEMEKNAKAEKKLAIALLEVNKALHEARKYQLCLYVPNLG